MQQADGVSSHPDDRSVQADARYPGLALQGKSNAGSGKPGPAATGQCASPANAEATAPQQYRSFSICLALSLVSVRPRCGCDRQPGDHHSLAPCWVSGVLALAIPQPRTCAGSYADMPPLITCRGPIDL